VFLSPASMIPYKKEEEKRKIAGTQRAVSKTRYNPFSKFKYYPKSVWGEQI